MAERGLSKISELIDQIGGERGKLDKAQQRQEAQAIKRLGERLGLEGFKSTEEALANREEELASLPREEAPGIYFDTKIASIDGRIDGLLQSGDQTSKTQAEIIGLKKDLSMMRSIKQALESGDSRLASRELEQEIDFTTREIDAAEVLEDEAAVGEKTRHLNRLREMARNLRLYKKEKK